MYDGLLLLSDSPLAVLLLSILDKSSDRPSPTVVFLFLLLPTVLVDDALDDAIVDASSIFSTILVMDGRVLQRFSVISYWRVAKNGSQKIQ